MFKGLGTRIKNFIGGDMFSNISILPFSSYKKNYSQADYLSSYEISLYANRAIDKRAEKVGDVQFVLKRGDTVIENHEIIDLLAKPNKSFTGKEFFKLYQKYYDIFGEVYILKVGELRMGGVTRINELHLLRSDRVTPFFNAETGELTKIEFKEANGTKTIDGKEIIYAHNPDPANPLRGESLLRSGIRQIETSTQIDEYQSKILENGGRVEGVFNFKTEKLNVKQLREMKEAYQEEYGNASKAGLPMFLAGDASYEKLGLSPNELAYLESKKVVLDDILLLTGVPRAILGLTSNETFSNADASIRIFLAEVIRPLIESLTTNINENLVADEFELGFVDPTPENKEEKRLDIKTASDVYALTTNEKRELLGLDPIKDGDTILVPLNLMPMSSGSEKIEAVPTKSKGVKSPQCRETGESKEQCMSRKIPEIMEDGKSREEAIAIAESMCSVSCNLKKVNHPLRESAAREVYHALSLKRLDRRQELVVNVVDEYFREQKDRLVTKLQAQKHYRKKDLLGEIFHMTLEIKLAKETMLPVLERLMKEAAEDSKEIAGSNWDFNDTPEINGWLDKKTSIFAEQINETTFNKLRSAFQDSLDLGESRQQLINRIVDTYAGISKGRAETIARTEVHGVTQYGTVQGYKQAGLPIKIWVWSPGTKGGVRDEHMAMDGEEVPMDVAFSNGLMFPGDYNGGADETINCQCFI